MMRGGRMSFFTDVASWMCHAMNLAIANAAAAATPPCTSAAAGLACIPVFRPDVLITDNSLIEKLRPMKPEEGGRTPAIALTAFARSEDRRQAMLAGFDVHVAKPVELVWGVVSRLARRG